jgi:hypothetical protein
MYTDAGAAADYVCLPPDPDFGVSTRFRVILIKIFPSVG